MGCTANSPWKEPWIPHHIHLVAVLSCKKFRKDETRWLLRWVVMPDLGQQVMALEPAALAHFTPKSLLKKIKVNLLLMSAHADERYWRRVENCCTIIQLIRAKFITHDQQICNKLWQLLISRPNPTILISFSSVVTWGNYPLYSSTTDFVWLIWGNEARGMMVRWDMWLCRYTSHVGWHKSRPELFTSLRLQEQHQSASASPS